MSNREYPSVALNMTDFDNPYTLVLRLDPERSVKFYSSYNYKKISNKGLKESLRLNVSFYNDVIHDWVSHGN